MTPGRQFASATARFAAQAARHRTPLGETEIQPYTGEASATPDGLPLTVFLSPLHRAEKITEAGVVEIYTAQLRVRKGCRWQPVESSEFVVVATGDRFRCDTAIGAESPIAAEIACQVIRIKVGGA